jgi:hypothetical protein
VQKSSFSRENPLKLRANTPGKTGIKMTIIAPETPFMFRRPLLLLALLSPALLGAGGWYYWNQPFEPSRATPRELCGWLLRNEAAQAAPQLQAGLFERCRQELVGPESALDWQELNEALRTVEPAQRATWNSNVRWWCREWWLSEGRAYARTMLEKRAAYLKEKIAQWSANEWAALSKLRRAGESPTSSGTAAAPASLTEWSTEIESWITSAPATEQPALQEFWAALRWELLMQPQLWRSLSG